MVNVVEFKGEFRFLSNFWPVEVRGPGDRVYASVEHAYQASKSLDPRVWREILTLPNAGAAKNYSRTIDVRLDWNDIRLGIMEDLLRQKFAPGSELAQRLMEIDGTIEEGNTWGDTFWGISLHTYEGANNLGRLLTAIRDELLASAAA